MPHPLFHIKKLVCSYNNSSSKALVINELLIPRGKLVFLLGASGAGKSTLLETLGMMNNTVSSGVIFLAPNENTAPINVASLWQNNAVSEITDIRKKHFSFIFQNTNLMENFTAYENVCLSGMIKENVEQEKTLDRAKQLMSKVKLPENEVGLNTLAVNLSGGQRQRLAFVRALNNNASILFGDEPTGNLDEANANELFEVIKSNLGESKSAIVVSHDINLAIKHADLIVVLTKDVAKGYGEVLPENIYARSEWEKNSDEQNQQFKLKIRGLFNAGNEQTIKASDEAGDVNLKNSYRKLFFNKEGNVLFGKHKANMIVLSVILFFTFLALGFANGSLDYLNKKMNSAFVNWVSITVPFSQQKEKVNELINDLKNADNRTKFAYNTISGYIKDDIEIRDTFRKTSFYAAGRTIDLDDDGKLMKEYVLEDKNVVRGSKKGFRNKMDISVIVTEKLLKDFHYSDDADFIYMKQSVNDTLQIGDNKNRNCYMPIPIRTVVKELPGKYYFVFTKYFYDVLHNADNNVSVFSDIGNTKFLYSFINSNDKTEQKKITDAFKQFISNYHLPKSAYDSTVPQISVSVDTATVAINFGYKIEVEFYPNVKNYLAVNDFWGKITTSNEIAPFKNRLTRIFDYGTAAENNSPAMPDQISIYFTKLDFIRDFSKFLTESNDQNLKANGRIEIDVTKVKEKEDFNFLSKVTGIISFLLIIFSTVAISLFIFNLLKMHLMKVRMNIGTFKAIGLGDGEARNIYFGIILTFLGAAVLISLTLAFGVGLILNNILIHSMKVDPDVNYFKIFDVYTWLALVFIVITTLLVSWYTIRKILSKSPGDLIYNR